MTSEYFIPIDKMLANGLRPERTLKDGPYLEECENLVVRAGGLISPDYFTQPTLDSAAWPLPQLFHHRGQTFVAGDDTLHLLNESTNVAGSALSIVEGRESYTPITGVTALLASGPWTFIALGPSFILLNKTSMVFKLPAFGDVYCHTQDVKILAGARHHNRLWFGGFSNQTIAGEWPDIFGGARWTGAFAEHLAYVGTAVETGEAADAGYAFFGLPHGGDVDRPYTMEFALFGMPNNAAFDVLKTHIYGALRKGEMGFVRLKHGGTIYKLLPLGQQLIAYSSRAVEIISLQQDGLYVARALLGVGVPGPGAVTGDDLGHTFVTRAGTLYRLGSDMALQRLGFEEFLNPLTTASAADENLVLSTEPRYGDVHLCNSTAGYVLGDGKLTKVLDPPTSIVSVGDEVLATNQAEEEKVTDGALNSIASWTLGTRWKINGGKAHWAKGAGTLAPTDDAAPDIDDGIPCRLNYDISNWAGANTDATVYLSLGNATGQIVSGNGSYEDILVPEDMTDGLVVHPHVTSRGSIDNISINTLRRFKFTTGILRFGASGFKTIKAVELFGENLKGLEASIYWRDAQGDSWRQTEWQNMGPQARVIFPVTARELKVSVQGYLYDNQPDGSQRSTVDGGTLRYQLPDRTYVRGTLQGAER